MCGIVGYIGTKDTKEILLDGLKELEYRGYDSAGIAVLQNNTFHNYKAIGKLVNLEDKTKDFHTKDFAIGIGHTRWATHGKPTELNAHPHLGEYSYVVHNGIIENYSELKQQLLADGVTFLSQTDTEVIDYQSEAELEAKGDNRRILVGSIFISVLIIGTTLGITLKVLKKREAKGNEI